MYYHLRVLPRFIYHLLHLSKEQTRIDTLKCGGGDHRGDHQNFPTINSDILFLPVEKTLEAKTPGLPSNLQTLRSQNFRVGFSTIAQDRALSVTPGLHPKMPNKLPR